MCLDPTKHLAILEVLLCGLCKPPNVSATNNDGRTPLMLSILGQHDKAFGLLLPLRQNINLTDSDGCTALHHAGAHPLALLDDLGNKPVHDEAEQAISAACCRPT